MTRKLDALIAEKVMEWRKVTHDDWPPSYIMKDHHCRIEWYTPEMTEGPGRKGAGLESCEVPRFSSDIAAVWPIIEKIIADDNDIDQVELGSDKDEWYCLFVNGEFGEWPYATAKTVLLAICLAALRSAGVSEAEIQEALNE